MKSLPRIEHIDRDPCEIFILLSNFSSRDQRDIKPRWHTSANAPAPIHLYIYIYILLFLDLKIKQLHSCIYTWRGAGANAEE